MMSSWVHRLGQWVFGQENWLFCLAQLNLRRMKGKGYEIAFRHFVSLLPLQGTILDVGANLGVMSSYLKKTNPDSHIIAFEPIPMHARVMHRMFNKFDLEEIQVFEMAVGNYEGVAQMNIPVENGILKHGLAHIKENEVINEGEKLYKVPIQRIDYLLATQEISHQVIGIKIDVENYELEVLKGAIETIKKYRPLLIIELWNDVKKDQCIQLMADLGYQVWILVDDKLVLYKGQDALDYFFIPSIQA